MEHARRYIERCMMVGRCIYACMHVEMSIKQAPRSSRAFRTFHFIARANVHEKRLSGMKALLFSSSLVLCLVPFVLPMENRGKIAALLRWLRKDGGYISDRVAIVNFADAGLGIEAVEPIEVKRSLASLVYATPKRIFDIFF